MKVSLISLVLSLVAIAVSITTAWFTLFHRGKVCMSRPQFFAFVVEDGPFGSWIKFFVRSLLFSTGKRGRIVESMYANFENKTHNFQFQYWMYGPAQQLSIGSGLFVGPEGVAANHHFVPTSGLASESICSGDYRVKIFATLLGDKNAHCLCSLEFKMNDEEASAITRNKDVAIYFTWDARDLTYKAKIDNRKKVTSSLLTSQTS